MCTAEWIPSINCPIIFSFIFTFPFINNNKERIKHVLHVEYVHLVVVFIYFLNISNFYISVESF